MANEQRSSLKFWLLKTPIFFAITAFLFTAVTTALTGLLLPATETTVQAAGILTFITMTIAAILAIRRIGIVDIKRSDLVTVFNTQTIITVIASLISFVTISHMPAVQMWVYNLMQTHTGVVIGFVLATLIVLLSFYILGVLIVSLWAKFLRARAMNIPTWKIICSMPFGFAMTWIPGYFLSSKSEKKPSISVTCKWISALTKWTTKNLTNAGFIFAILIIATGLFAGLASTLLTLTFAMLFGIWAMQSGHDKFTKNIGGAYATTAVVINIAIIIYMITVAYII